MQIIKLQGGLGNQMFEYAFAKAYSIMHGCNTILDLSFYSNEQFADTVANRVYELNHFNISLDIATEKQIELCKNEIKYLPKFLRKIFNNIIKEKHAGVFDKKLLEYKKNAYIIGYFQTEKYFKKYRNEILKDFTLNIPLNQANTEMLEKIKSTNSVSLHVRRGDYVNLQHIHGLCDLEYYNNAIRYITKNVNNPHFFLFSDDIDWVKENLKIDYEYTIVDINSSNEGYFDLELMKNCKHNIIANSSFSWWGAWLNNNPQKIVIAPTKWFADKKYKYDDIICNDWVRM